MQLSQAEGGLQGNPHAKVLIKDHKTPDEQGRFPTCLAAPATNFTAGFPKLGHLGIKQIFDSNNVDHGSRNIVQAVNLKTKLEEVELNSDNATIASIGAEAMCPSTNANWHVMWWNAIHGCDTDPGRGTSRVVSQSRVVEPNHGRDSTGAQGGASFENRSAGVPIPAALSNNQCGVLCEEDDQFRWEIARSILCD